MGIRSQKDFFSGLMFVVVGIAFAIGSGAYTIGDGARMGPGYFPRLLGIVLTLLGLAVLFNSFRDGGKHGDKIGKWAWRPVFFIIFSNLAFGVCLGGLPSISLPPLGLIAGIYALTLIAAKAGEKFVLRDVLILATVLAIGSYAAFIMLLKLQMPVWPTFIA